ncbi:putative ubiquitin-conjugating enzyme E2 23, partial [Cymbomonas tetramitiformis]
AVDQRHFLRKVNKEWRMLRVNLPETIWVRCFEDRTELLRAAILGAAGTPYHDGLFLFDICLPGTYPNEPPEAYYHSGGLRVNPNLYENGKVCLSLLNTWQGKDTEVWNPHASSLLQVLVSIQGLVLVPKPYYNEAGYSRQMGSAEGEHNARLYNESAFLLSCKTMLNLMRNPPAAFAPLIRAHFRQRRTHILQCCDAYMAGAGVGTLPAFEAQKCHVADSVTEDGSPGSETSLPEARSEQTQSCSSGFKLMLAKVRPQLVKTFESLGP